MEQNRHSDYSDEGWKGRGRKNKEKRQADSRHYKQDYTNFDHLEAVKAINITTPYYILGKSRKKPRKIESSLQWQRYTSQSRFQNNVSPSQW